MIKAVLFDVGGTLISPNPSVGAIYAEVAKKHGQIIAPDVLNDRFRAIWKKRKKLGLPLNKEWWRRLVTDIFENYRFPDFDLFFGDVYDIFNSPRVWKIESGAVEVLTELKKRGLRLAIASNWDARLPTLLKKLGLFSFFEHLFISSALGCAKPNPKFFKYILKQMDLRPSEVMHIGDDLEEDFEPAQKIGLLATLFGRKEPSSSPILIIRELKEVLDCIDSKFPLES